MPPPGTNPPMPSSRERALVGSLRIAACAALLVTAGCASGPEANPPVERQPSWPTLDRVGMAAYRAAVHPATWVPAAAALVMTADHWDRHASNWLSTHTPIFGSQHTADTASTILDGVQGVGLLASTLATPVPSGGAWWLDKTGRVGIDVSGMALTEGLTEGLKNGTRRVRPNGEGHSSFPSGHTSFAFSLASQTSQDLEEIAMPDAMRWSLDAADYGLAASVGWARVEAKKHFPTDVLAGAAIGNFLGYFVHDAFLESTDALANRISIRPKAKGVELGLAWSF